MSCEKLEHKILTYADGRISDAALREVEAHLSACADCRARVAEFRSVSGLLDELPAVEPSLAFDARLRERIAAEPAESWLAWLVPAPRLAFALSLLAVLAVWIGNGPVSPPQVVQGPQSSEEEFRMIKELPVLEDYDVLSNFEPLSQLPRARREKQRNL